MRSKSKNQVPNVHLLLHTGGEIGTAFNQITFLVPATSDTTRQRASYGVVRSSDFGSRTWRTTFFAVGAMRS